MESHKAQAKAAQATPHSAAARGPIGTALCPQAERTCRWPPKGHEDMVGAVGFEPTTFWSRTKRATSLRYAPTVSEPTSRAPPLQLCGAETDQNRPAYIRVPNTASSPRMSAMRSNWLYFAIRSLRLIEPVLIWPALVATAMSAIVASSVSPER